MPDAYRNMWIILMYDLPTSTKAKQRRANAFRKKLESYGFERVQFSVYKKLCADTHHYNSWSSKIASIVPPEGDVRILGVTTKQYSAMTIFDNRKQKTPEENGESTQPEQYFLI